jgi:hypothetical protein
VKQILSKPFAIADAHMASIEVVESQEISEWTWESWVMGRLVFIGNFLDSGRIAVRLARQRVPNGCYACITIFWLMTEA